MHGPSPTSNLGDVPPVPLKSPPMLYTLPKEEKAYEIMGNILNSENSPSSNRMSVGPIRGLPLAEGLDPLVSNSMQSIALIFL